MKLDKDTVGTVLKSLTEIAKGDFSISDDDLESLAMEDELQAELFMGLQMLQDTIQYQHQQLKESEEELREEKEKVEQSLIFKDQFLANMSHEIRTPLNGIIGLNEVLEDTTLSTEQQTIVGSVRKSGESLLVIINDILDFSKIEAGKLELEFKPFDVLGLIAEIEALFAPKIDMKGLSLEVLVANDMPAVIVSDEIRLKQILINLIGNAVKFTEKGKIQLKVSVLESMGQVFFQVIDTGIGIERNDITKIFNSFDQADATITRRYGGTGLGLSITKSLTGLLGGGIQVTSKVGEGSNFSFTINYRRGVLNNDVIAQNSSVDLSSLKVLVAEDNLVNQQLIHFLLDNMGITHDIVDNGKLVVDYLANNKVDVILMDVQMPEMDGLEATRYIRRTLNNSLSIIALTANAYKSDRDNCLDAGMDDYLSKPISKEKLSNALAKGKQFVSNLN